MLEVGWSEILVIVIILIVVVGPKDLPKMLRTFGAFMRKARSIAGEFQGQFNDALREAELDEVRKTIQDVRSLNPKNALKDAFNPLRQAGEDVKRELQKSQAEINAKAAAPLAAPSAGAAATPMPAAPAPAFAPPSPAISLGASPPPSLALAQPDVGAVKPMARKAAKAAPKAASIPSAVETASTAATAKKVKAPRLKAPKA
jgi:sec-independent protein translocase protein TatB